MLAFLQVFNRLHKDLMYQEIGMLKIADFGLSKSLKLGKRLKKVSLPGRCCDCALHPATMLFAFSLHCNSLMGKLSPFASPNVQRPPFPPLPLSSPTPFPHTLSPTTMPQEQLATQVLAPITLLAFPPSHLVANNTAAGAACLDGQAQPRHGPFKQAQRARHSGG